MPTVNPLSDFFGDAEEAPRRNKSSPENPLADFFDEDAEGDHADTRPFVPVDSKKTQPAQDYRSMGRKVAQRMRKESPGIYQMMAGAVGMTGGSTMTPYVFQNMMKNALGEDASAKDRREFLRGAFNQSMNDHPITSFGSALVPAGGIASLVTRGRNITQGALAALGASAGRNPSLLNRGLGYTATGAGSGGLASVLTNEDIDEVPKDAAVGGLFGGTTGMGVEGAGRLGKFFIDRFRPGSIHNKASRRILESLDGVPGPGGSGRQMPALEGLSSYEMRRIVGRIDEKGVTPRVFGRLEDAYRDYMRRSRTDLGRRIRQSDYPHGLTPDQITANRDSAFRSVREEIGDASVEVSDSFMLKYNKQQAAQASPTGTVAADYDSHNIALPDEFFGVVDDYVARSSAEGLPLNRLDDLMARVNQRGSERVTDKQTARDLYAMIRGELRRADGTGVRTYSTQTANRIEDAMRRQNIEHVRPENNTLTIDQLDAFRRESNDPGTRREIAEIIDEASHAVNGTPPRMYRDALADYHNRSVALEASKAARTGDTLTRSQVWEKAYESFPGNPDDVLVWREYYNAARVKHLIDKSRDEKGLESVLREFAEDPATQAIVERMGIGMDAASAQNQLQAGDSYRVLISKLRSAGAQDQNAEKLATKVAGAAVVPERTGAGMVAGIFSGLSNIVLGRSRLPDSVLEALLSNRTFNELRDDLSRTAEGRLYLETLYEVTGRSASVYAGHRPASE